MPKYPDFSITDIIKLVKISIICSIPMLYIVGTPIGNLKDLSIRQAETLANSDIILAEDTRSAKTLLSAIKRLFNLQINPNQRLISYYREKEFEKLPEVISFLNENKKVSLISESGMPLISDPGYLLVKSVIKESIPFTVIPGPTAAVTALVTSGFNPKKYMFLGFVPKKEVEIIKILTKLKDFKQLFPEIIVIFYESPQRVNKTLELIAQELPNSEVVIARELTKLHEEIIREKLKTFIKGELTIAIRLNEKNSK